MAVKIKKYPDSHAREIAMQALYQMKVVKTSLQEANQLSWLNTSPSEEIREHCLSLISGVLENYDKSIELIQKCSHKDLSQISTLLLCILQIGICELKEGKWNYSMLMDDLLELARKYAGEDAVSITNGILDAACKHLKQEEEKNCSD